MAVFFLSCPRISMYFSIIGCSLFSPFGFIPFRVFMEFVLTHTRFQSPSSNCSFPLAAFLMTLYMPMTDFLKAAANNLGERVFAVKQRVDLSVT